MRSLLLLACLLLGTLIGSSQASQCTTTTRFLPLALNTPGSQIHMSLGGKIDTKTGAVTLTSRSIFEFPSTACVKKLTFSSMTGKAIVQLYGRTDSVPSSSFEVTPSVSESDTVLHIRKETEDGADCGTSKLTISLDHGATVTLSEIEFCPSIGSAIQARSEQKASTGALRRRTVDDDVEDATVYLNATYPIIPAAYCNRHIISDGSHSYCYAVFGYSSANNVTITMNSSYSYYVGARNYNENPSTYFPGTDILELSAFWICDRHISPYLKLIICTQMDKTKTHLKEECYSAVIFKDYKHRCEDELVDWINPELVPELFAA